jgi:hypothetical protein
MITFTRIRLTLLAVSTLIKRRKSLVKNQNGKEDNIKIYLKELGHEDTN